MAYNVLQIERDCTPRAQSRRFDDAQKIYENRKRFMSKETFNAIRRGLYPGSRRNISDEKLAEAFDAFMSLEKHVFAEKDSPTDFGPFPSTLAKWDKMRAVKPRRGRIKLKRRSA